MENVFQVDTGGMDAQTLHLMLEEIEALATLDSPFVVRIFESASEGGMLEIIEEKLPGGDVPPADDAE